MTLTIILLFIAGYLFIAFEHVFKINKSAIALLTGVLCWTVIVLFSDDNTTIPSHFTSHIQDLAGILFFLMGAMTIVEIIDAHDGFDVITSKINTTNPQTLLWIICIITFFLSAVLDNLTTAIVMVSLLRKLITEKSVRLYFIGMVVIAANAGGAFSPVGDVTTTMLWIGGQITASNIIIKLFIPAVISLLVPLLILSVKLKGAVIVKPIAVIGENISTIAERNLVFWGGLGALLFVPVFKTITHLPPFMGVLFGLSILWVIIELIHKGKDKVEKDAFSVVTALQKIDVPSILFFLGILLAISALETIGVLSNFAEIMNNEIGNINIIVPSIGALSAVIDNVPLVAATMGMYDLTTYPCDSYLWEFLAYCAGTGGSILIIGSAAGVAAMGMEDISFMWYLKKISWLAIMGYICGAVIYILQDMAFHSM